LANSAQAKKRARQAEGRRRHNASLRSLVRTVIKKVIAAIDAGDAEQATAAYGEAVPVIDRLADMGIIHNNTAARQNFLFNDRIKALSTLLPPVLQ
jgi:small subunit ribosomal protein S20